MQLLFLIPMFISAYYVMRGQAEKAFLNIYIPSLLVFPTYYAVRLPHVPTISMASGAIIPIAIAVLLKPRVPWRFKRMDLWVVLFMIGVGFTEITREYDPKAGAMTWIEYFWEMFCVYVVARQIIEPNLRLELIKRIIFCFMIDVPLALFEYRMGYNPYQTYGQRFLAIQTGWFTQLRGGHARVASVFAHAILAGMLFTVAIAFDHYLRYLYKQDKFRLGPRMSKLQKYRLPLLMLPVMLYLTGSRMPMACGVLCYMMMLIPRFKSVKTGSIVILSIVIIGGGAGYSAFQGYVHLKSGEKSSGEEQSSAIYRQELLLNYAPALEVGGWFGWGMDTFPRVPGQFSVDNNYLIFQLAYGKFGRYIFIILGIEGILSLWLTLRRIQTKETQVLVFSLMTGIACIFIALTTVAIFEQVIQMTFLLLGWSQSLQDTSVFGARQATAQIPEGKFRFRRVFA